MKLLFKLKHYVKPYFQDTFYSAISGVKTFAELQPLYWISGYEKNVTNKKWKFENGIPMGLYNSQWKGNVARRTHICALTEYYFALDPIDKKNERERIVGFIIDNLQTDSSNDGYSYCYWRTYLSDSSDDYFVHGMGQGQILSLLTRARINSNDERLDKIIVKVANSFKLSLEDKNGFVDRSNGTVLQEYPHLRSVNNAVLNGWILSAIGLHDYLKAGFKDPLIKQIFDETILTLKNKLPDYDIGYWSLYNLPKCYQNIASAHYHGQHIVFLYVLGTLIDDALYIYIKSS